MRRRSALYARALPVVMAFSLVACDLIDAGGDNPEPSPARASGVVTAGLVQIGNLDPPRSTGEAAHTVLRTACDPLVALDPSTFEPRPALAMRWKMSPDATLLTLTIRPKVTFSDGSAVDAAAIRENLSRVVRPSTSSPWAMILSPVTGHSDVLSGAAEHLSGITIHSEQSLDIKLDRPFSDLPALLSHPALIPVSPGSVSGDPPALPSCAGPYRLEAGAQEGDLRLTRQERARTKNESYESSGKGFVETIAIRNFESSDLAFEAFSSGHVDLAPVPEQRVAEAISEKDHVQQPVAETTYLAFDPVGVPDVRLRKAISLSIDRLVIVDAAFGDQRQPAVRWVPEAFGSRIDTSCSDSVRKIADPVKAKSLFAETGLDPASVNLSLVFDASQTGRLVAQAIQVQVKDTLGVNMIPTPLEPEAFEASIRDKGKPQVWMLTTTVSVLTLDQVLGNTFRSGSTGNRIGFNDAKVEELLLAGSSETDTHKRRESYYEAEDRICDLMPATPLWSAARHWMIRSAKVEFEERKRIDPIGSPILRHAEAV